MEPLPPNTDTLCSYCSVQHAVIRFKNGRYCCEVHSRNCPAQRQKYIAGAARDSEKSRIPDENGLSPAQKRYRKATETKKNTIDPNGVSVWESIGRKIRENRSKTDGNGSNSYERAAAKAADTKLKNGSYKEAGRKYSEWSRERLPDGTTRGHQICLRAQETKRQTIINDRNMLSEAAIRAAATRRNTLTESGLTVQELASKKFKETIQQRTDTGETKAERRARTAANTRARTGRTNSGLRINVFPDTEIWYQGSYELRYLTELRSSYGIEWVRLNVSRGPSVRYYDFLRNSDHWYFSDFIVNGVIVEIKSSAYWNRENDVSWLVKGYCKLEAASKIAPVLLILDHNELLWNEYRDFVATELYERIPNIRFDQNQMDPD